MTCHLAASLHIGPRCGLRCRPRLAPRLRCGNALHLLAPSLLIAALLPRLGAGEVMRSLAPTRPPRSACWCLRGLLAAAGPAGPAPGRGRHRRWRGPCPPCAVARGGWHRDHGSDRRQERARLPLVDYALIAPTLQRPHALANRSHQDQGHRELRSSPEKCVWLWESVPATSLLRRLVPSISAHLVVGSRHAFAWLKLLGSGSLGSGNLGQPLSCAVIVRGGFARRDRHFGAAACVAWAWLRHSSCSVGRRRSACSCAALRLCGGELHLGGALGEAVADAAVSARAAASRSRRLCAAASCCAGHRGFRARAGM